MEELIEEQKRKKYNKFQWFLAVILVPSLFAIIVAAIVASFAGVDVWGKTKEISEKIPFIPTEEEKSRQQKLEKMESQITDLTTEIQLRDDTIIQLENEIEGKQQEIQTLTLEVEHLEAQLEELRNAEQDGRSSQSMNEITRTFENMSAKRAAAILEAMNENDAITILSNVKSDTLAGLLEKMTPEAAAKYTTILTNRSEG